MQGFGNVGSWAARDLSGLGAKLTHVGDHGGYIKNNEGFDVAALCRWVTESPERSVKGSPGGDASSVEELFAAEVDALIPAALGRVLTADNAASVRAKLIVDGANGPTTPDAHDILTKRGVQVIPDILANAGGVTVSYFEWVQNNQRFYWDDPEVTAKLSAVMRKAYLSVTRIAKKKGLDIRIAAFITAIREVGKATVLRGL